MARGLRRLFVDRISRRGGGDVSEKTRQAYVQDLRVFARWFAAAYNEEFSPEKLTQDVVKRYFDEQAGQKTPAASRNRRLASLRAFVKWCIAEGLLRADPTVRQSRARQARLPRRAKDQGELNTLEGVAVMSSHLRWHTVRWKILGDRDLVIFFLFKDLGLRIQSVSDLDIADIDLDALVLHVKEKGDIELELPISQELAAVIAHWLSVRPGQGEALVCDWTGKRLTTGQIRRRLYQIAATAGIEAQPHSLRHTHAQQVIQAAFKSGMPFDKALDITRSLLGHGSIRTTLGYLRASLEELKAVNELAAKGSNDEKG